MAKLLGTLLAIAALFFVAHTADAGQSVARLMDSIENYQPKETHTPEMTCLYDHKCFEIIPETFKACLQRTHSESFCKRNFDEITDKRPNCSTYGTNSRKAYNNGLCQF